MQRAERFQDPKINFILNIIAEDQAISTLLNRGLEASAAKRIAILLIRLEIPKAEKEVIALRNSLTPESYCNYRSRDITAAYRLLSSFLNRTYFKEFSGYQGIDPDAEFDGASEE